MADKKNKKNLTTINWMKSVSGRKRVCIVGLLIIQMLIGISGVANAIVLKEMIDAAVAKSRNGFFLWTTAIVLLMGMRIGLNAFNRYLSEYSRAVLENRFKERLMSFLFYQEYADISMVHSAEWMNRLTSDTTIVANGMTEIVPGTAGMTIRLIGAIGMLLILYPAFCWLILPGGMLLIVLTYVFRKKLKELNKKVREADGELRVSLQENLSSMLVVRIFAKERQILKKTQEKMAKHKESRMVKTKFSNICNIGFACIMNSAYVIGAGVCGYGILTGTMSYGTLMAVIQLVEQVQSPFANITGYLPRYYAMLVSAERLMEVENMDKRTQEGSEKKEKESSFDDNLKSIDEVHAFYDNSFEKIELRNIGFAYRVLNEHGNDKNTASMVLDNLNFTIHKGEFVALTGPSGCGKSTLLKILMCLYPLSKGDRVMVTNKKEEIALTQKWRRMFAYVPQGNYLMSGTIREVIAFGDTEGMQDEKRIFQVLSIACADEFVNALPLGIDTILGENGSGLSEGQMQRIAIARALFTNSPILILDELTSALDEMTEKKVLKNLRLMTDKTVLIVTHRTAALEICDREMYMLEENQLAICPI